MAPLALLGLSRQHLALQEALGQYTAPFMTALAADVVQMLCSLLLLLLVAMADQAQGYHPGLAQLCLLHMQCSSLLLVLHTLAEQLQPLCHRSCR